MFHCFAYSTEFAPYLDQTSFRVIIVRMKNWSQQTTASLPLLISDGTTEDTILQTRQGTMSSDDRLIMSAPYNMAGHAKNWKVVYDKTVVVRPQNGNSSFRKVTLKTKQKLTFDRGVTTPTSAADIVDTVYALYYVASDYYLDSPHQPSITYQFIWTWQDL